MGHLFIATTMTKCVYRNQPSINIIMISSFIFLMSLNPSIKMDSTECIWARICLIYRCTSCFAYKPDLYPHLYPIFLRRFIIIYGITAVFFSVCFRRKIQFVITIKYSTKIVPTREHEILLDGRNLEHHSLGPGLSTLCLL